MRGWRVSIRLRARPGRAEFLRDPSSDLLRRPPSPARGEGRAGGADAALWFTGHPGEKAERCSAAALTPKTTAPSFRRLSNRQRRVRNDARNRHCLPPSVRRAAAALLTQPERFV